MQEFFSVFLEMNLSASLLILFSLALRVLFRSAPKRLRVGFWGIVGLRLIVPFSLRVPLLPAAQPSAALVGAAVSPPSGVPAADPYEVAAIVWLSGVFILLGYMLFSLIRLRLRLRESVSIEENVKICDGIKAPFVIGIFSPTVFLPSALSEDSRPFVLLHERAHISRRDVIWKPLGFVIASLSWFNPSVWLGYYLFTRDIELACDEHVVGSMSAEDRKAYSSALLECSVRSFEVAACPFAFGENPVKKRVKSILGYQKPKRSAAAIAAVVCAAASALSFVIPVRAQAKPARAEQPLETFTAPSVTLPTEKADETASVPETEAPKPTAPPETVPEPAGEEAAAEHDYSEDYEYSGDYGYSDDYYAEDNYDSSAGGSTGNSLTEITEFSMDYDALYEREASDLESYYRTHGYYNYSSSNSQGEASYDPYTDANGNSVIQWDYLLNRQE